jgi:hypothetical protein
MNLLMEEQPRIGDSRTAKILCIGGPCDGTSVTVIETYAHCDVKGDHWLAPFLYTDSTTSARYYLIPFGRTGHRAFLYEKHYHDAARLTRR